MNTDPNHTGAGSACTGSCKARQRSLAARDEPALMASAAEARELPYVSLQALIRAEQQLENFLPGPGNA